MHFLQARSKLSVLTSRPASIKRSMNNLDTLMTRGDFSSVHKYAATMSFWLKFHPLMTPNALSVLSAALSMTGDDGDSLA